jgi:pimeloyl-ACP methyl ester carboxylesterase
MPVVSSNGVRIYYETEGEGPAVLLQTGAGGDLRIWKYAGYPAGLQGFRRILMDQRGRGRSDRPDSIESHRMERHVEDVVAILDGIGVERCAFWGYSNGILAGLAFGSAHPSRLAALIGTGGLPFQNVSELPPVDLSELVKQDVAQGGVRASLDRYIAMENERFPTEIDQNVRADDPLMHALDRAARRSWRGPLALYDGFQAPTLILAGEREDTERETERSVARIPHASLHRIPGVGHLGAFYRSDLSLPLAIPFLKKALE